MTTRAEGNRGQELSFIDMTMAHHRQGIETANLAERKAESGDVKDFARKTRDDQQKELTELKKLRTERFKDQPKAATMRMPGRRNDDERHMQQMAANDMAKLERASGPAFDRLFLDTRTKHHRDAIKMSEPVINGSDHPDVKSLARRMSTAQRKDIYEMTRIKQTVAGAVAPRPFTT